MKPTIRATARNPQPTLYLAFELSDQDWQLGFTVGLGQPPRQRKIAAGDTTTLKQEITLAKQRFGLPADAAVVSCYEAGRAGFPGLSGQDRLAAPLPGQRTDHQPGG